MGGVNLVVGFRPELWREVSGGELPTRLGGFDEDLVGADGFVMPATQHDAVLWLSGSAYDEIFDVARAAVTSLRELASLDEETSSWPYRHDRDLTGFIDGSENPDLIDAPELVLSPRAFRARAGRSTCCRSGFTTPPRGRPDGRRAGAGDRADEARQHRARPQARDSHVATTDQDRFGKIFRRNTPFGTVGEHGTMFVGFSAEQEPLVTMLESMAGSGTAFATLSRATRDRSPGRTTSSRRRKRCGRSARSDRSETFDMRLNAYLARTGVASRRGADELIKTGRVRVNGVYAGLNTFVEEGDVVDLDGRLLVPQALAYVLLHKPAGVVTTASDPHGRPTVVELVEHESRVVPVGRLDADTTGVLLLTNDGELAHRLAHPRYEVEKVYEAEVEGEPSDEALAALERRRRARRRPHGAGPRPPARPVTASSSRSTKAASTRSSACSRRSAIR